MNSNNFDETSEFTYYLTCKSLCGNHNVDMHHEAIVCHCFIFV